MIFHRLVALAMIVGTACGLGWLGTTSQAWLPATIPLGIAGLAVYCLLGIALFRLCEMS